MTDSWLKQFEGQPFDETTPRGLGIIKEWLGDVHPDTVLRFLLDETDICACCEQRFLLGDMAKPHHSWICEDCAALPTVETRRMRDPDGGRDD